MTAKQRPQTVTNHRDAGTGRFVTEQYVKRHPGTTTTEHNRVPSRPAPSKPTKR